MHQVNSLCSKSMLNERIYTQNRRPCSNRLLRPPIHPRVVYIDRHIVYVCMYVAYVCNIAGDGACPVNIIVFFMVFLHSYF